MYYVIAPPRRGPDLWMVSLPGPEQMRICAWVNPLAATPIAWEFETGRRLTSPSSHWGSAHQWTGPQCFWQEVSLDELERILGARMVETLQHLGDYPTQ